MTQNNLGLSLRGQARRGVVTVAASLLAEATTAFRASLEVLSRDQFPQRWATIQINLGGALSEWAERSNVGEAVHLLGEAATAFRAALEVWTTDQSARFHHIAMANLARAEAMLQRLKK
jgi:hypothetical protein